MPSLTGKNLVTIDGSRGIGRSGDKTINGVLKAREGARVFLTGRNLTKVDAVAEETMAAGVAFIDFRIEQPTGADKT
jgi:hypothetical protein